MAGFPLHLLLADAETRSPALPGGVPAEHLRSVPVAEPAPLASAHWDAADEHPSDLRAQKWALVVPEGKRGAELAAAVGDLRALREEEQGAPADVLSPELGETAAAFARRCGLGRGHPDRPRYLLILGDAEEIGFDVQMGLGHAGCFVGRLCFPSLEDYRSYSKKVCDLESVTADGKPGVLLFGATESAPTQHAAGMLVDPAVRMLDRMRAAGDLGSSGAARVTGPAPGEALRRAVANARHGVLLTVTHGLGAAAGSAKDKVRETQGALLLDTGEEMSAATLREVLSRQPFLPGGLWFCFACFGAGVPRESAYRHWLAELDRAGVEGAGDAHSRLPSGRGRAFVSALPQVALASPDGPIGFVGHVDVGWSHAYMEGADGAPLRILSALKAWANGQRAGTGLSEIHRAFCQRNEDLTWEEERRFKAAQLGRPDPTDPEHVGHLWITRNDLGAFVLLGDPAARLPPVAPAPPRRAPVSPAAPAEEAAALRAAPPGTASAVGREIAVLEVLTGAEAPAEVARRAGVPLATLWAWVDSYRRAGRRAIDVDRRYRRDPRRR
jgi:hypothetical protein